jgi:HTH-type transcriptional regulator / antitoxin HigA
LLLKHLPQPITSEGENERALAIVQNLMAIAHRSPEEDSLLELLVQLIERFEEEHYSFELNASEGELANPRSILLHLMEENDLKQADLVGVIGSRGVVSEVVNGKREISKAQATALARLFHVDVGLFIALRRVKGDRHCSQTLVSTKIIRILNDSHRP